MRLMKSSARRHRRLAAATALALGASLALSACGGGSDAEGGGDADGPITVAITGEVTGPASFLVASANGVKAALQKINEDGGIDGRQVEFGEIFDSKSTAEGGSASAQQAVATNPSVVFSTGASSSDGAATAVYARSTIPVFSVNGTEQYKVPPTSWAFGLGVPSEQNSAMLIAGLEQQFGDLAGKTIGFVGLESPAVDQTIDAFEEQLTAKGGKLGPVERTAFGNVSFATQAAKMQAAGLDAVVTADAAPNVVVTAKALTVAGFDKPILSTLGAADDKTLEEVGLPNYSAFRISNVPAADSDIYTFSKDKGVPEDQLTNPYFTLGWGLAYAAAGILEKCPGACSPADFTKTAESLGEIDIPDDALLGPVSFTADKHNGLTGFRYFGWDGTQVAPTTDALPIPE